MKKADPFDWLTRAVSRLPGAKPLGDFLERHRLSRRWAWFIAIYVVSVTVFGAVAIFLNALVPTK
jgi:predicted PurR-regulated permease PerM